jgi:hypothetical protein
MGGARDLAAHDCVNLRFPTSGVVYRSEFTENGKDPEVAVDGRLTVDDAQTVIDAAVDGVERCQRETTSSAEWPTRPPRSARTPWSSCDSANRGSVRFRGTSSKGGGVRFAIGVGACVALLLTFDHVDVWEDPKLLDV